MGISDITAHLAETIEGFYNALGHTHRPIELHPPYFSQTEAQAVAQTLNSGWVAMAGPMVRAFEQVIADYVGSKHAVATINATAGLHLALKVSGVQAGDFVITQSNTFIAPVNAIRYCGAEPIFADVENQSLGLCPEALADFLASQTTCHEGTCYHNDTQRPIRALLPIHVLGHPVEMSTLKVLAERYHLKLIEDAAEALGSAIVCDGQTKRCGSWGDVGVISFNANKIITSGAGGMVLTDDDSVAEKVRHLACIAKKGPSEAGQFDAVGYNYGMPNLNAAIGLMQWQKFEEIWATKQALALHYHEALATTPGARLVTGHPDHISNAWINAVVFEEPDVASQVLKGLREQGLMARSLWEPLHQSAVYKDCIQGALPNTDYLASRTVQLPSGIGWGGPS